VTGWREDIFVLINFVSERFYYRFVSAKPRSHTSHPSAGKSVQNEITRHGVVQDVPHDRLVWHLCVVAMCRVNWVVFPFTYIRCKWLLAVLLRRLVWPAMS